MIRRGEIWWASLPEPRGSEPGYRRPVVVLQADSFNRSRISTVMVAPLTGNTRLSAAPGNVLVRRGSSGLPRDSVVNVSQVLTVDKSFLMERVRSLPSNLMRNVDAGLRLSLSLR
ncbi:type II toxin-antitoxin system toxin endoribonuclease MazF6 [soil metagenome]